MGLDIGPATVAEFAEEHRRRRARSCGTARWACSSCEPFAAGTRGVALACADGERVHRRRRRRLPRGDQRRRGSRTAFDHLSTGGGASLEFLEGRALPGITILEDDDHDRPATDHRGELEDAQDAPGGDPGRAEARLPARPDDTDRVEVVIVPAVHRAPVGPDADRLRQAPVRRSAPRTSTPRTRARSPARSRRRCSQALQGRLRDRRPLRAPPAVRRGRRVRQQEGAGGVRPRHDPDPVRRGDARGARGGRHRVEGDAAGAPRVRRGRGGAGGDRRGRLRADLGDRHRPQRRARRRRPGGRGDPRGARRPVRRRVARAGPRPVRRAASSPATSAGSWRIPRSTARWWAAPASTPRTSP